MDDNEENGVESGTINKNTTISIGVLIGIVTVVIAFADVKYTSSANASQINNHNKELSEVKKNHISVIKSINAVVSEINTRLSRIEGMLEEQSRGKK